MTTIALARKYRPRSFPELIGQDHVTKALSNSLARNRLHHAYLFTGTRGVGKTSTARLFAKALSCESGITPTPCLECDACVAIEKAAYIDLIEIDAASKTRVEDTRELLDNVSYAPTQGRFKVYLIDEVHMLSTHSFNALLKTLEEPPAHVIFLLATTEAQKLPMTVLSRCLQFHLNALPAMTIAEQLKTILTQEKISFDFDALALIANAANGSVRDALSLLDQIIASADDRIQLSDVKKILGHTSRDYALEILTALAHHQPAQLLTLSHAIAAEGGRYDYVLDEILSHLHQISRLYILPEKTATLHDLSELLTPEDTQLLYQIALKGQDERALAPTDAIGFEMTLLRMHTFKPATTAPTPPLSYEQRPTQIPPAPKPEAKTQPQAQSCAWEAIIPKLKLSGLALNAAKQADLIRKEDGTSYLKLNKKHRPLFTDGVIKKLEQAVSAYYNKPIKLTIQSSDQTPNSPAEKKRAQVKAENHANQAILDGDATFQSLKEIFASE